MRNRVLSVFALFIHCFLILLLPSLSSSQDRSCVFAVSVSPELFVVPGGTNAAGCWGLEVQRCGRSWSDPAEGQILG